MWTLIQAWGFMGGNAWWCTERDNYWRGENIITILVSTNTKHLSSEVTATFRECCLLSREANTERFLLLNPLCEMKIKRGGNCPSDHRDAIWNSCQQEEAWEKSLCTCFKMLPLSLAKDIFKLLPFLLSLLIPMSNSVMCILTKTESLESSTEWEGTY